MGIAKRYIGCLVLLSALVVLSSCDKFEVSEFIDSLFTLEVNQTEESFSLYDSVYSDLEHELALNRLGELEDRFGYRMDDYESIVDNLWEREGYYKKVEGIADVINEKETLIDFYLFMEYHKETQLRNLQFPDAIQKELLLIEALFAGKAIEYVAGLEFTDYAVLRDDLVTLYRNMYREEIFNILFENSQQVIIRDRIPNIISRYDSELHGNKLKKRLEYHLGIPDSVIARGMGLDLITLYSETGNLDEGDLDRLALLLALEMRISGINLRLEKFFYVTQSLEGLGEEISELRKDIDLLVIGEDFSWVNERMSRSLDFLEDLYLYYKGDKQFSTLEDIFIDIEVREDFYALGLLSDRIRYVIDRESYWEKLDSLRGSFGGSIID